MEPTGIGHPYVHGAYLGLERAVRELGIRGRVLTPTPKEGYVPSLSLLARQKYDLVIGFAFFAAAAIDRVATGFPETRVAIIDFAHDDLAHRPRKIGRQKTPPRAGLAALVRRRRALASRGRRERRVRLLQHVRQVVFPDAYAARAEPLQHGSGGEWAQSPNRR